MKIVLGSASKARQKILSELGFEFDIAIADIDEGSVRHSDFRRVPLMIAQAKSEALQRQIIEPVVLITADSVVIYKNELREKPKDEDQAREFLRSYGDGPVEVVSAVYIVNTQTGKTASGLESGKFYFHKVPEKVIHELVLMGRVMEGVGAFDIDDPAIQRYIVHTESPIDCLAGLPKNLTKKLIEKVYDRE
jgi:septum formation protein